MSNRFVRGASVNFSIQFKDINGNLTTPSGGTLVIVFHRNKTRQQVQIALTDGGGGNWTAEWASDPADLGSVYWWAQSGDPPKSAIEGSFTIEANDAAAQA